MTRLRMWSDARIRLLSSLLCIAVSFVAVATVQAQQSRRHAGQAQAPAQDGAIRVEQTDRWLFVPVLAGPLPSGVQPAQLTAAFEAELRSRGTSVLMGADAPSLFELRHSAEPVHLDNDELARLMKSVSQAARNLALGELPEAQEAM